MKIEFLLVSGDLRFREMDQGCDFSVGVPGADMLNERAHTPVLLQHLCRRRPGASLHFPQEQPHSDSLEPCD